MEQLVVSSNISDSCESSSTSTGSSVAIAEVKEEPATGSVKCELMYSAVGEVSSTCSLGSPEDPHSVAARVGTYGTGGSPESSSIDEQLRGE
ncbi:hypothetical protein pipiens_014970, partial [Culex pipiens pipiens]